MSETAMIIQPETETIDQENGPQVNISLPGNKQQDKPVPSWDLAEALKMRMKNQFSLQAIADHYGLAKSTVHQRFQAVLKLADNPDLNRAYEVNKAELFTATERILLNALADEGKLKAASLNNVAYTIGQIHNMGRLEKNLSTANIAQTVDLRADARTVAALMSCFPKVEGNETDPEMITVMEAGNAQDEEK